VRWWLIGLLMVPFAARAEPCCGEITPQGRELTRFLDGSGVDHLWVSGWHVDWRTGQADREEPGGPEAKTHCSAFAAAMAERLHIYVLRPPEHQQSLLANAQMGWLREVGTQQGWRALASPVEAQSAANRGELVLEAFENPDPHKPGHIAIVRPSDKTREELDRDGPEETQAGARNALSTTTAAGFHLHHGAWLPGGGGTIRYYAHAVDWP
jgi:hypothetical protein